MPENTLMQVAHLSWQGGVVIALLFFAILFSKLIKTYPRDLIFTIAALLTSLSGIVSSKQIYQAATSQAILAALGLWMLGKSMQQQGLLNTIVAHFPTSRRSLFYTPLCGAFLHHRYFLQTVLRSLLGRKEITPFGYAFCYLLAIGGLATAIGTPTNLVFISLYSATVPDILSNIFIFLPLAILPILLSIFTFLLFDRLFDRALAKKQQLFAALKATAGPKPIFWKKIAVSVLFVGAIIATFFGMPVGGAFLCAGLIAFALRSAPIKTTFREEFPLPPLLEIFSAALFFFAMLSSGLNIYVSKLIPTTCPICTLPLFFLLAQLGAHGMPRPVALSVLLSVAISLFSGSSAQVLIAGTVISFASAIPLFGKPSIEETAAASMITAAPSIATRALLLFILFAGTVIPSCLFWPK